MKYSLLSLNCEHFCNWCCIENQTSYQVENVSNIFRDILSSIGSEAAKVLKVVCKLVSYSIDDIAILSHDAQTALVAVPWGVLGVIVFVILVYTIYRHIKLSNDFENSCLCLNCYERLTKGNWTRFLSVCMLQAGGLGLLSILMTAAVSKGIVAGVLVVTSILAVAVTSVIPKVRRLFLPPFHETKGISIGDVISIGKRLSIDYVVFSVDIMDSEKANLVVMSYSRPKIFGKRTIVKETIYVNLKSDRILVHDYSSYDTYTPEAVIERAQKRLGEQKFGIFDNRSCHFCYWAKVKDKNLSDDIATFENIGGILLYKRSIRTDDALRKFKHLHIDHKRRRKYANKCLGSTFIKIRDEITEGQIVSFKNDFGWKKAVTTHVAFDDKSPSKLDLTVVVFGKAKTVCEKTFPLDLCHQHILVDLFHPVNRFNKTNIARRARALIGNQERHSIFKSSSDLVRQVAMKNQHKRLYDLDDLKQGDAISFNYWSLPHDGLVVSV